MLPARILRLLATNHIFIEVSPDVFANNRLSSILDTGKSVEELLERLALSPMVSSTELTIISPESKHIGTLGITSIIEHGYELFTLLQDLDLMRFSLDDAFKSSSYLIETLFDTELGHANEANKTALNKARNIEGDFWGWLERPDNRLRLARFGSAMNGLRSMSSSDAILEGSVMLRGFASDHLTSSYRTGRVCLGKSPRGLAGCRCRRRRWPAVVDTRYPSTASSLRCPGPRVCRRGCSRGI
jgi:hypothetical protein